VSVNPAHIRAVDIPWASPSDACSICGRDSCEEHTHTPSLREQAIHRAKLVAQRALDLVDVPSPAEIIEGIAWAECLTVFVSESGAGKTFLLFDAAGAVSDDVSWHGRSVRFGSVAYISFEGDAIGLRLRAMRDILGRRLEHLYVIRAHDPLSPLVTRDGEARSIGELNVVATLQDLAADLHAAGLPPIVVGIIDTVRASLSGSEDSSEDVSAYLRAVRRIMAAIPGSAWILAHHAGWQDGDSQRKRERGSSAWRGNCDATLYLEAGDYDAERGETRLTLRALKVRDAERPAPLHLVRRRVELNEMDTRGEPVTSCVIEPDRRTREDRDAEVRAVADREQHQADMATLQVIAERPEMATSQDSLRLALGTRKAAVSESLSRLVRRGCVLPGRRNQPYTVTDAGRVALAEVTL